MWPWVFLQSGCSWCRGAFEPILFPRSDFRDEVWAATVVTLLFEKLEERWGGLRSPLCVYKGYTGLFSTLETLFESHSTLFAYNKKRPRRRRPWPPVHSCPYGDAGTLYRVAPLFFDATQIDKGSVHRIFMSNY